MLQDGLLLVKATIETQQILEVHSGRDHGNLRYFYVILFLLCIAISSVTEDAISEFIHSFKMSRVAPAHPFSVINLFCLQHSSLPSPT